MISKASARFVRISPRKVRYVIDHIRSKSVAEAQSILNGAPRRAGEIIRKLLNAAVDAAQKNSQVGAQHLFVSKVMADGGPTMKRFRAATMGRASIIRKRLSHIYLELDAKKGFVPQAPAGKTAKKTAVTKAAPVAAPAKAKTKASEKKLAGAK